MVNVARDKSSPPSPHPSGLSNEGSRRFEVGYFDMSASRRARVERWIDATAWRYGIREPFLLDELHANLWPKIVRGHRRFDLRRSKWQTLMLTIIRNECKTMLMRRSKRLRTVSMPEGFDILFRPRWEDDGSEQVGKRFAKLLSVLPSDVREMLRTLLYEGKKNLPKYKLAKWLEYLRPALLAIHLNDDAAFDTQIRFLEAEWADG